MSTLDVVAYAGEEFAGSPKPANFLDIGGGASAEVMANGLEIIIGDAQVKSVFVNVFGGITACDAVANGIVQAFELLASRDEHVDVPLVVRLDGNNAELGRQILTDAGPAGAGAGRHDGRSGPPGRRAGRGLRGRTTMSIFLNADSKVIVQGMTGSEGRKHTAADARLRHPDRRRRHPRQGRPEGRVRAERACRCSTRSARRSRPPGRTSR